MSLPPVVSDDGAQNLVEPDQAQPAGAEQCLQRGTKLSTGELLSIANEHIQEVAELESQVVKCFWSNEKYIPNSCQPFPESTSEGMPDSSRNERPALNSQPEAVTAAFLFPERETSSGGPKVMGDGEAEAEPVLVPAPQCSPSLAAVSEWKSHEFQHQFPAAGYSQPTLLGDKNAFGAQQHYFSNSSNQHLGQATQEEGKKRMNSLLLELSADNHNFGNLNLKKRKDISECSISQHGSEQSIETIKNEFIALEQRPNRASQESGDSCSKSYSSAKSFPDFIPNANLKVRRRSSDTNHSIAGDALEGKSTSVSLNPPSAENVENYLQNAAGIRGSSEDKKELSTSYDESFMIENGVFDNCEHFPNSNSFETMEEGHFYDSKLLYTQSDENSFLKEGGDLLPFLHPISALSQASSSFDFPSKHNSEEATASTISGISAREEQQFFDIKHRKRTSRDQLVVLERSFAENSRPTSEQRKQLAVLLDMTPRGVQIWFQNRRAKLKAKTRDEEHFNALRKNKDNLKSCNPLETQYFAGNGLQGNSIATSFRIDPFYQQFTPSTSSSAQFSAVIGSGKQTGAIYHTIDNSAGGEPAHFPLGQELKNDSMLNAFSHKFVPYNAGSNEATNELVQCEQYRNGFKNACPFNTFANVPKGPPLHDSERHSLKTENFFTLADPSAKNSNCNKNDSPYQPIRDALPNDSSKSNSSFVSPQLYTGGNGWTSSGVPALKNAMVDNNCYSFFPVKTCPSSAGSFGNILTPERSPSIPLANVHPYGTAGAGQLPLRYNPIGKNQKSNSIPFGNQMHPPFQFANQKGNSSHPGGDAFLQHQYSAFPAPVGYKSGFPNYQYYPNARFVHPTIVYPGGSMYLPKQHPVMNSVFPKPSNIYQVPFSSGGNNNSGHNGSNNSGHNGNNSGHNGSNNSGHNGNNIGHNCNNNCNNNSNNCNKNPNIQPSAWPCFNSSQWNSHSKLAISHLSFNSSNVATLPELSFSNDKPECSADVMKDIEAAILNAPFELDSTLKFESEEEGKEKISTSTSSEQSHFDSFVEELHQNDQCSNNQKRDLSRKGGQEESKDHLTCDKPSANVSQFNWQSCNVDPQSFQFSLDHRLNFSQKQPCESFNGNSHNARMPDPFKETKSDSCASAAYAIEDSYEPKIFGENKECGVGKEDLKTASSFTYGQSGIFKSGLPVEDRQNFVQFSEIFGTSYQLGDLLNEKQSCHSSRTENGIKNEKVKAASSDSLLLSEYLNE